MVYFSSKLWYTLVVNRVVNYEIVLINNFIYIHLCIDACSELKQKDEKGMS